MNCELCAKKNILSFKYIWNNRLVKVCQECKENDLKKLKKYLATKPKSYKITKQDLIWTQHQLTIYPFLSTVNQTEH